MPDKTPPKLSVVIPVYNERATIHELLQRVRAINIEKEIIVVDDGSTDGTRELLQELSVRAAIPDPNSPASLVNDDPSCGNTLRVILQETNCGKGAALRKGFQECSGRIVLIQDADLEYDPRDYFRLLDPIERGEADVVYGSRFQGGPHRVLLYWHSVGNKFLTTLSNIFTNLNLSDVWTCYKAFRREVLQHLELKEDRFGFEPEVTAKVARAGWRIFEVPISYAGRTYGEGKKITWRDAIKAIFYILRYNLFS